MTWTDIALSAFCGAYAGWLAAFLATHLRHAGPTNLWEAVGTLVGALAGVFLVAALMTRHR